MRSMSHLWIAVSVEFGIFVPIVFQVHVLELTV